MAFELIEMAFRSRERFKKINLENLEQICPLGVLKNIRNKNWILFFQKCRTHCFHSTWWCGDDAFFGVIIKFFSGLLRLVYFLRISCPKSAFLSSYIEKGLSWFKKSLSQKSWFWCCFSIEDAPFVKKEYIWVSRR